VGYCKPTRQFFDAVAMKVGLPPADLLLIDDSDENVRAAIAASWGAAHWTGRQRLSDLIIE
jgi:putative hydrolase of the HAD superfamily